MDDNPVEFLRHLIGPVIEELKNEAVPFGKMHYGGAITVAPWPLLEPGPDDTHYGISLFGAALPDFRRKNEFWTGTFVIGLDDVGEVKDGIRIKHPPHLANGHWDVSLFP